jgi:hypothetical protein
MKTEMAMTPRGTPTATAIIFVLREDRSLVDTDEELDGEFVEDTVLEPLIEPGEAVREAVDEAVVVTASAINESTLRSYTTYL